MRSSGSLRSLVKALAVSGVCQNFASNACGRRIVKCEQCLFTWVPVTKEDNAKVCGVCDV
jgi:hypothetical protein